MHHDMVTIIVLMLVNGFVFALQVAADHSRGIENVLPLAVEQVPVAGENDLLISESMFGNAIRAGPDVELAVSHAGTRGDTGRDGEQMASNGC